MKNILMVVAMSSLLGACAGGLPWGPQQEAGIETLRIEYGKQDNGKLVIDKVFYRSGKETQKAALVFELPDGTKLNFDTEDARAFEGQALRARVEEVVLEQVGNVAPGVVDAIVGALTNGTI